MTYNPYNPYLRTKQPTVRKGLYRNSKIFMIRSTSHPKLIFIGTTYRTIDVCYNSYKTSFNVYKRTGENYFSAYEVMKYEDYYLKMIECYPCSNRKELHKRARKYIMKINCVNANVFGKREIDMDEFMINEKKLRMKRKIEMLEKKNDIKIRKNEIVNQTKNNIDETVSLIESLTLKYIKVKPIQSNSVCLESSI